MASLVDAEKEVEFHAQFKGLHKTQGALKLQMMEDGPAKAVSQEFGLSQLRAKQVDLTFKIGIVKDLRCYLIIISLLT